MDTILDTNPFYQVWWPPPVAVDPELLRAARAKKRRLLPPDPRSLPAMPQEILLNISSRLDQKSHICLSLTCVRLFNDLPRPSLGRLKPAVRTPLLLLLERDIPDVYFCHHCTKFHQWARFLWEKRVSKGMSFITYDCRKYRNPATRWTPSLTWDVIGALRLPFHLPQLIMNRHFWGRRLSMLDFEVPMVSEHGPRCTKKWTAKIVDGELMLRSEMRVEYSGRGLRLFLDYTPHGICKHNRLDATLNRCIPFMESSYQRDALGYLKQAEELSHGRHVWINGLTPANVIWGGSGDPGTGPWFTPAGGALRSCQRCMTDSVINLSQREPPVGRSEAEGDWVVTVRTWHDLGSVRSPADWKWAALVEDDPKLRREARDPAKFGKGAVWRKWVASKVSPGG